MSQPDSEPELIIEDECKCNKQKIRGKKRKRTESNSSSDEGVLPENTLEMEKNLHASAIKNNLDDASVKKILKKVVTNDHVLALVKLREEEEGSGPEESLKPKLTRAKAKELMKVSPKSAPWNLELTPIKHIPVKTRPEVKALIAQELPDDEDDEEYEPTHDDVPSDDDHVLESSSDIDSLPRTPATPQGLRKSTPKAVTDGPFKIPMQELPTDSQARRKLVLEEDETIALRTRSKLSLSATSIEHIESSFVPPDDLPMPDVDSLWNDFLEDCLNPASNTRHEEDDEADPEYNVAADPDANEEDEESLENSIIKISKKELNDLVTELFSIIPEGATGDQIVENMMEDVLNQPPPSESKPHWEGKQEPPSDNEDETANSTLPMSTLPPAAEISVKTDSTARFSIGKSEPPDHEYEQAEPQQTFSVHIVRDEPTDASAPASKEIQASQTQAKSTRAKKRNDREPPLSLLTMLNNKPAPSTTYEIDLQNQSQELELLPQQVALLQQQLRQHVQLATSSFLQLFVHPTHWATAPSYRQFLTSLVKMVEANPASVVNVCNLKPAVELVDSWDEAVSQDTPENNAMVQFMQKEVERSRRRTAQNALYVGDFPELFMEVVANSTVFLYPYLLPPLPFKPESINRRFSYMRSEDELIAMGLLQFWEYVHANPHIYKPPSQMHPRRRWGLSYTVQLVVEHMLPWLSPKTLLGHIGTVRKSGDPLNPINKFFLTGEVTPPKQRLLTFNPRLTLYEQPEHEFPRIWVRYLSKASKRFMKFKHRRHNTAQMPKGVDLDITNQCQPPNKIGLPIEFTKEINCNRLNVLPPKPTIEPINRVDVPIATDNTPTSTYKVPNVFTVVNTSIGSFLVPVHVETKSVNATVTPICAPIEANVTNVDVDAASKNSDDIEGTKTAERSNPAANTATAKKKSPDHCSCCILLRKICGPKQRTILEYFKGAKPTKCDCKGRVYPKITNRLKLLVNNYKIHSQCVYRDLQDKLMDEKGLRKAFNKESNDGLVIDDSDDDLAIATSFQLKVTTRTAVVRDAYKKKRIHTLFSRYDIEGSNAMWLAKELYAILDVELDDLYKEFLGFLTAEQADMLGCYKDYFVHHCIAKLIRKIEELVPDKRKRCDMLTCLHSKYITNFSKDITACDICTDLLSTMEGYPALARYLFSMFPHRQLHSVTQDDSEPSNEITNEQHETEAMDYEADNSSSEAEGDQVDVNKIVTPPLNQDKATEETQDTVKKEPDADVPKTSTKRFTVSFESDTEVSDVSDEETSIKRETAEWKREEDKIILEVLKEHISPQERKDKTILDIIDETQVLQLITDSLAHKSVEAITERILYLLQLLVISEK